MSKIVIKTAYAKITPESAAEGDYSERGWVDEEGVEFEDVDEAVRFLEAEGVAMPSATCFHRGLWYETEGSQDYATGEYEINSYFVHAPEDVQREIFERLFPEYNLSCRAFKSLS